jgi:hypothetical protein
MFPPVGAAALNVTLCVSANVHVTVPPGAIVTVAGLNAVPLAATVAVDGFGPPPAVTVTATWADWTPSEVALICDDPAATPVAVTDAPVVAESETFD